MSSTSEASEGASMSSAPSSTSSSASVAFEVSPMLRPRWRCNGSLARACVLLLLLLESGLLRTLLV
jgi:hypothetical protein